MVVVPLAVIACVAGSRWFSRLPECPAEVDQCSTDQLQM